MTFHAAGLELFEKHTGTIIGDTRSRVTSTQEQHQTQESTSQAFRDKTRTSTENAKSRKSRRELRFCVSDHLGTRAVLWNACLVSHAQLPCFRFPVVSSFVGAEQLGHLSPIVGECCFIDLLYEKNLGSAVSQAR